MEFNDRRPGKGQLDFWGGEHPGQPSQSAPDPARQRRQAALAAGKDRHETHEMRYEDEITHPDAESPPGHYGLPTAGLIDLHSELGVEHRQPPQWATFHGSSPSARLKHSTVKEVPIQSAAGPVIRTHQPQVSAQRFQQQIDRPETMSHPRLGHTELPYAYHDPFLDEHTVVDGTHRVAKAVAENQMFQPMRVFTDKEGPAIRAHTKRMDYLREQAHQKTQTDPWQTLSRRQHGSGYIPNSLFR